MHQLHTDLEQRDRSMHDRGLELDRFPTAAFTLTRPVPLGLPPLRLAGRVLDLRLPGELTLHGVTRPVVIPVQARWDGATIQVAGSLQIRRDDFGLRVPELVGFKIQQAGVIEFELTLRRKGATGGEGTRTQRMVRIPPGSPLPLPLPPRVRPRQPPGPSPTIYLREGLIVPKLDRWLSGMFSPEHLDRTCAALAGASRGPAAGAAERAARRAVADCDKRLARYRATLDAGGDPAVVAQWIKETQAQRAAAEQQLQQLQASLKRANRQLSPRQVRELVERAGGAVRALKRAEPADKHQLYGELGLRLTYQLTRHRVMVEAHLQQGRGVYVSVGGGT